MILNKFLGSILFRNDLFLDPIEHRTVNVLLLKSGLPEGNTEVNQLFTWEFFEVFTKVPNEAIADIRVSALDIRVNSKQVQKDGQVKLTAFDIIFLQLVESLE